MNLKVPLPISVNDLYKLSIQKQIEAKQQYYNQVYENIQLQLGEYQTLSGDITINIVLYMPLNRDIDNRLKIILDMLVYYKIIEDDKLIMNLNISKKNAGFKEQRADITISGKE